MPRTAATRRRNRCYPREFAIPDIHGDPRALRAILRRIPEGESVVFLGDLVNRGDDSLGALSVAKECAGRYQCRFLWGNHDLQFVRAMRGSLSAQVALLSQANGCQIVNELGAPSLKRRLERVLARHASALLTFPHYAARLRSQHAQLFADFNTLVREHHLLQQLLDWMSKEFELFYLSPSKTLYLHAGIPLDCRGAPRIDLRALRKTQQSLRAALARGRLDAPVFLRLVLGPDSPLRLGRWTQQIPNRAHFCRSLGVRALVVGHFIIGPELLHEEPAPIVLQDFGASSAVNGIPSLCERTSRGEFISHLQVHGRWRSSSRGRR